MYCNTLKDAEKHEEKEMLTFVYLVSVHITKDSN